MTDEQTVTPDEVATTPDEAPEPTPIDPEIEDALGNVINELYQAHPMSLDGLTGDKPWPSAEQLVRGLEAKGFGIFALEEEEGDQKEV